MPQRRVHKCKFKCCSQNRPDFLSPFLHILPKRLTHACFPLFNTHESYAISHESHASVHTILYPPYRCFPCIIIDALHAFIIILSSLHNVKGTVVVLSISNLKNTYLKQETSQAHIISLSMVQNKQHFALTHTLSLFGMFATL